MYVFHMDGAKQASILIILHGTDLSNFSVVVEKTVELTENHCAQVTEVKGKYTAHANCALDLGDYPVHT